MDKKQLEDKALEVGQKALKLHKEKNFQEAEKFYLEAIELIEKANPNRKMGDICEKRCLLYYNLALVYVNMGKRVTAIDYFWEAFASAPQGHDVVAESCEYIAALYESLGNLHDAERWFLKAVRADCNRPSPHINLGRVFFKLEKYELAEQAYLNVIDLDPCYALAYNKLSELYSFLGKEKEAKENAEKAKELYESGTATEHKL